MAKCGLVPFHSQSSQNVHIKTLNSSATLRSRTFSRRHLVPHKRRYPPSFFLFYSLTSGRHAMAGRHIRPHRENKAPSNQLYLAILYPPVILPREESKRRHHCNTCRNINAILASRAESRVLSLESRRVPCTRSRTTAQSGELPIFYTNSCHKEGVSPVP